MYQSYTYRLMYVHCKSKGPKAQPNTLAADEMLSFQLGGACYMDSFLHVLDVV